MLKFVFNYIISKKQISKLQDKKKWLFEHFMCGLNKLLPPQKITFTFISNTVKRWILGWWVLDTFFQVSKYIDINVYYQSISCI